MCLNIETPKNHYFPFRTNGEVVVLSVPILKHFRVFFDKNEMKIFRISMYITCLRPVSTLLGKTMLQYQFLPPLSVGVSCEGIFP